MSGVTNTLDTAATSVLVDGISDVSVYNGYFPVYPMLPYITDTLSFSLSARVCVRECAYVHVRACERECVCIC